MFNWIKRLFVKEKEKLPFTCIVRSILKDIANLPIDGWKYEVDVGFLGRRHYQTIFHKERKWALHCCLFGNNPYVELLGYNNQIFTEDEEAAILANLLWLREKIKKEAENKGWEKDLAKLREQFPNCCIKSL